MPEPIRTGLPDVAPDAAAHTPHVHQGNSIGNYRRQVGHRDDGTSTAARSTGIDPRTHEPILPGMPDLSPA